MTVLHKKKRSDFQKENHSARRIIQIADFIIILS